MQSMQMPQCRVLRCQEEAARPWTINTGPWDRRIEVMVCAEHFAQLDADAPHQLTDDDQLVMDPDDLAGSHERLVVGRFPSVRQSMADAASSDSEHRIHVLMDVRRRGGSDIEELDLVLTDDSARVLATLLQATVQRGEQDSPA
jgi:hypothetical protein